MKDCKTHKDKDYGIGVVDMQIRTVVSLSVRSLRTFAEALIVMLLSMRKENLESLTTIL